MQGIEETALFQARLFLLGKQLSTGFGALAFLLYFYRIFYWKSHRFKGVRTLKEKFDFDGVLTR